ncbi:MAG: glucose-1-phosphate adenylyltransferase [Myxococcales bacterium]|nr:glucose-1-phosphate adenylyltransferase [Myxococcales bacterium]
MPEPSRSLLALILAGGEGTRLLPLTRDRAKPAVPFGGRYRLIDFVLSNFVNSGFFQIKVLTQYKASSLISHITRGWQLAPILGHYVEPVPAQMRVGRDWFKGSADAVFQNLNLIADSQPEVVAVFGADHIYKMDVSQMVTLHLEKDADLTIAAVPVPRAQATAFGVLAVDAEGRVTDFVEKPADPPEMPGRPGWSLASMGNYLFRTQNLVEAITQDATRVDSVHDFGRNIISQMVRDGRVYAYDFDTNEPPGMEEKERGYWRDVGTLDSYWEASMDLVEVTPIFNLYNHRWPIRTTYQHLPPAKFVFNLEGPGRRGYATDSLVSPGGIISGGHVHRSVLAPKVRVHSWSEVEASVLGEGCEIHRGARVRRAIFDKFVTVEEGATVGFDPEHDRARGLTVTESGVVAATKGLHIPR